MKVEFNPEGGRYGVGFDYYCVECGAYVGNSSMDERLEHAATERKWSLFKKVEVPIKCSKAGKVCELPRHEIEAKEIT